MNTYLNTNKDKLETTEEAELTAKMASQVHELLPPTAITDGNNGSGELLKNPFQRSSRLAHSPPDTGRTRSASPCLQHFGFVKVMTAEEIYQAIGNKVKELAEMMELPKRNINQPMRDLIANITDLHKKLGGSVLTPRNQAPRGANEAISAIRDKGTQTSPLFKRTTDCTPKRAIDNAAASAAKRSKTNRAEILRNTLVKTNEQARTEKWEVVKTKKNQKGSTQNTVKRDDKKGENNDVKINRRRRRPPRKDAIVVKSAGSISYAEILKRVKTEPSLKELSNNIQGVKKTAKGELLLLLEKSSDPNTSKVHEAVKAALGETVDVRALTELRQVEIRDLDEITTKEEVHEAVARQFQELEIPISAILGLRKAYGGTQTATLKVTPEIATKLAEANKIRIGLVICRIREKIEPKRCFKCMEYGHVAVSCKSSMDLSNTCFKCGNKDHQAKNCTQTASCIMCKKKKVSDTAHAMTSSKCPQYLRAVKEIRQK